MSTNFYVYAYIRSRNTKTGKAGEPYYIGKGRGKRAYGKHNVSVPKDRSKIVFLETNLTEIGALAIERRLIKWWGRIDKNTGILHNKTDGGDGSSGLLYSETQRKARSERMLGNSIAKNTVYTDVMRKARSERLKKNNPGKGHPVGLRWWTDGKINKKSKQQPGKDFVIGMTVTKSS